MKTSLLLCTLALCSTQAMAITQQEYWNITRGKDASEVIMQAGNPDVRHIQEWTRCNNGQEGYRELWQYRGHGDLQGKSVSVKLCGGKVESADKNFGSSGR